MPPAVILLLACLMVSAGAAFAESIPVELRHTDRGWQLLRDGEPYFVRGAGGDATASR